MMAISAPFIYVHRVKCHVRKIACPPRLLAPYYRDVNVASCLGSGLTGILVAFLVQNSIDELLNAKSTCGICFDFPPHLSWSLLMLQTISMGVDWELPETVALNGRKC